MSLTLSQFEAELQLIRARLEEVAATSGFKTPSEFELAVVNELRLSRVTGGEDIVYKEGSQNFPDIVVSEQFGVEVKFKTAPKNSKPGPIREIANSVFEGSRIDGVTQIFIMFCRMGEQPVVRLRRYEDAIYHVRTSHSPRFAISMDASDESLFGAGGALSTTYEEFRTMSDRQKMDLIKGYARRKHPEDWLWWVDDETGSAKDGEFVIRNYVHLSEVEKRLLIAEAIVLVPECLGEGLGGRGRHKSKHYQRIGTYWLRAHSVYCGNVRDTLTAGSVVDPCSDGNRMRCLVRHTIDFIPDAISGLSSGVMLEFWGEEVRLMRRLDYWLRLADKNASGWTPSLESSEGFDWKKIRSRIR